LSPKNALLLSATIGALIGFAYGEVQIAKNIRFLRETYDWVCGTGLNFPLLFWVSAGALTGAVLSPLGHVLFKATLTKRNGPDV